MYFLPGLPQASRLYKLTRNRPKGIEHGLPPGEGWKACIHHMDLPRDDVIKQRQMEADRFFDSGDDVLEFRISVPCLVRLV